MTQRVREFPKKKKKKKKSVLVLLELLKSQLNGKCENKTKTFFVIEKKRTNQKKTGTNHKKNEQTQRTGL